MREAVGLGLIETAKDQENAWDFSGGLYADPDPDLVDELNRKYSEPSDNIMISILKSLELAGVIKPHREIVGPLEQTGYLPLEPTRPTEVPVYRDVGTVDSLHSERRGQQLINEFTADDKTLNDVWLQVKEALTTRRGYDEAQVKELWAYGKGYFRGHGLPPSMKILTVMLKINQPENHDNVIVGDVLDATRELAPDVLWMLLRKEEEERAIHAASDVA